MFAIFVVLSFLGYALFMNRFFRWPVGELFFPIAATLICVLYAFALVDLLQLASLLLLITGCALSVIILFLKAKENSLSELLQQPGLIFFLLGSVALWLLTSSDYFSVLLDWDDFSNWARTSKVIFLNNGLVQLNDPVWQKDYPPGAALFHYYAFQLSGYSVSTAFFAQGLLLLAACSGLLSRVKEARLLTSVLVGVFFYFLFHSFGLGFHTLTVDLLIAVFFGCGISAYWMSDRSIAAIIRLMPIVMVLPLIKIMGVVFAAIMIAVVVTDQLWRLKHQQSGARSVLISLLLLPLLFLSFMSWQHHFKEMGASKTFNADVSIEKVVLAFSDEATEYQELIKHNFVDKLLSSKAFMLLLILFLGVFAYVRGRENDSSEKGAVDILFFWLFIGLGSYLLLLLVLYIFFFGDYEAVRLASFNRYVKTYLVGFSIVIFAVLFFQYLQQGCDKLKRYGLFVLLLFSLAVAGFGYRMGIATLFSTITGDGLPAINITIDKLSKKVSLVTPRDAKIHFIWQNSVGLEMQMFSYGTIPRLGNHGCWSVGEKYYDGDVWTCEMDVENFKKAITGYDYLFLGHVDDFFRQRYKELFKNDSIEDGQLYKILKNKSALQLVSKAL